jgi:hypothetical protein
VPVLFTAVPGAPPSGKGHIVIPCIRSSLRIRDRELVADTERIEDWYWGGEAGDHR